MDVHDAEELWWAVGFEFGEEPFFDVRVQYFSYFFWCASLFECGDHGVLLGCRFFKVVVGGCLVCLVSFLCNNRPVEKVAF